MNVFDIDTWREIGETIGRNKRRSIATAFGVFWGILMLIILLSISNGFRNGVRIAMNSLAPNSLFVWPNATSVAYDGLPKGRAWTLSMLDVEHLLRNVPEISVAAGSKRENTAGKSIHYANRSVRGTVIGISSDYFNAYYIDLKEGRLLSSTDYKEGRKYCLIGVTKAKELFKANKEALGKTIQVNGNMLTIIGVIAEKGKFVRIGVNHDESVVLPLTTLNRSTDDKQSIDMTVLSIRDGVDQLQVKAKVERVLKDYKRIAQTDKRAVEMFDVNEMLNTFTQINTGLNILVWIVGIGTLLTGIVGISNILLVTISERTQEIGVRRALGAKPRDIIIQIIMESISLTMLAGLLGIVCGVGIMSMVASNFTELGEVLFVNPMVDLSTVLLALAILIASGMLAGLIPAMKAINIKAIDAIREE